MSEGLSVLPATPAAPAVAVADNEPTVWRNEAEALHEAAMELQRIAVALPVASHVRTDLLDDAKRLFTAARLRSRL